ncbi:MAG: HrcA family transcriptional regulator, partial [Cyanobacteria bacterium J06558_2]
LLDSFVNLIIRKILQQELRQAQASFEALLQRSAKILATLSGYIALITLPQKNSSSTLRHLQLVRVAANQVMLIVVTDCYQTQSIVMESPLQEEGIDESTVDRELQFLSNFLDQELGGCLLSEINALDWSKNDHEFSRYAGFIKTLVDKLKVVFQANNSSPLVIHGVAELLRQPEFSQLQQVQTLLSLLEEKQEQLSPIIFTLPNEDALTRVKVTIGTENDLESMRSCALISANYYQDEIPVGSVGVLGPKRMLYENAIALVEYTADYLSHPFQAFA